MPTDDKIAPVDNLSETIVATAAENFDYIIRECKRIVDDEESGGFHRLAALKLIKETSIDKAAANKVETKISGNVAVFDLVKGLEEIEKHRDRILASRRPPVIATSADYGTDKLFA